jgi:hypothetical protein
VGARFLPCGAPRMNSTRSPSWRARIRAAEAQGRGSLASSLRRRKFVAWSPVPALLCLYRMRVPTLFSPRALPVMPGQASRGS